MIRRTIPICFLLYLLILFTDPALAQNDHFVRWVDDGDTVLLADGRRLRYIGINAPEVAYKEKKGEPFGEAAKDRAVDRLRPFNRQLRQ